MKKILILGAGFGGLETATGLAAVMKDGYEITLVDRNNSFFIGFSKIEVLFGRRSEFEVRHRYADLRAEGVRFVQATITTIDTDAKAVATSAGSFGYDYLVVALGADLDIDATAGFRDSGAHEFYSMAGVLALRPALESFTSGTLVIGILGSPYKCPPAPYEVACQLHDYFQRKGVREKVTLKMVIPGPRPVPSPSVSDGLEKFLAERSIELVAKSPIEAIDAAGKALVLGPKRLAYDLFVCVPVHVPPRVVKESKLGNTGFIQPNLTNLETAIPGVYAIGDVAKMPVAEVAVPKAGVFAEDAARTVVADILTKEGLAPSQIKFEARGACYFELSEGQVGRVNGNFLGGDKPSMVLEGPAPEWQADKLAFATTRRDRWFKSK